MRKFAFFTIVFVLLAGLFLFGSRSTVLAQDPGLTPIEELGKALFFDENLSANGNQSCATCHGPAVGFTGPDSQVNAGTVIYQGSVHGLFGNRKPPAASYAGDSPLLHLDASGEWVGGMFWDGRATGNSLATHWLNKPRGHS